MSEINLILFYGITFGILIMTIVYTFIRYLYSKEIFYISYCFMQIFSLNFFHKNTPKVFCLTFGGQFSFIEYFFISLKGDNQNELFGLERIPAGRLDG